MLFYLAAEVKPEEFWPARAVTFAPRVGLCSKKTGRKILVAVGTSDWCAVQVLAVSP